MRRREWLGWSASVLFGAACSSSSPPPVARSAQSARPPRVAVVGGGLAGLAAARELSKRGFDVTVLEAQDRPGGRILTIRSPFHEGLFVEAGAAHVVGDPLLLKLAEDVGVEVVGGKKPSRLREVEYFGGLRKVLGDGDTPSGEPPLSAEEEKLGWEGRLQRFFAPIRDQDPSAAGWPSPALAKYDDITLAEHLKAEGASSGLITNFESSFCANGDATAVSALSVMMHVASILRESERKGGGRFQGGTDALPRAITAGLGDRIQYQAVVKKIVQQADGAHVELVRRGRSEHIGADFVVCAVPAPVLARIVFEPSLSQTKRKLALESPLASVVRLGLESKRRFWIESGESGRASTDLPIGDLRHETERQQATAGILGGYLVGERARRFAEVPEDKRVVTALDQAEQVFPGMKSHFTGGFTKCWDEDPYALGAYAWHKPGQVLATLSEWSKPEGRVHFAGDHTSYRPGFMHGALVSSARVVEEIDVRARR